MSQLLGKEKQKMEKAKTRKIKKWDEVNGETETEISDGIIYAPDETAGAGPSISRNPMRGIEDMVEQNDNSFDGIINNVRSEADTVRLELSDDDNKSVLEKLKEQSKHIKQPKSIPENISESKPFKELCPYRGNREW